MKITMQNTYRNWYFRMAEGYSSYPKEEEILLFEGLQFLVTKVEKRRDKNFDNELTIVHLYNDSKLSEIAREQRPFRRADDEVRENVLDKPMYITEQARFNRGCGGCCQLCCLDCLHQRWSFYHSWPCPVFFFFCNCFCCDRLPMMIGVQQLQIWNFI